MLSSDLYIRVRKTEGRLFSDEAVARLPEVPSDHPLRAEWQARAASLQRLCAYIARRPRPARILELGCGNGWLSHRLSSLPEVLIWGLDIPGPELHQAARVCGSRNAGFLAADIFRSPFPGNAFDLVIVASAIQYFPDLPKLIHYLRALLNVRGELHILDSPLYEEPDLPAARARTQAYYTRLGYPEMTYSYFHHTFAELEEFSPHLIRRPGSLKARLLRLLGQADSPFPWLCIR